MIGLPLRLLAREVYDSIKEMRGASVVALVTGEERIIPPTAQYWVCTTEAMPVGNYTEFLAVDEIQLCADPERGYVFTDRLLHARGQKETLFLGAETMKKVVQQLVPSARIESRERFSKLAYSGSSKISRTQPRTAIVAFTVDEVYFAADVARRQRGGAAVVMGALSPRTRNAQVGIYQNGDVDILVATDAIGMGLNLDINHVAFVGLSKFDGQKIRNLAPNELAQIAGRAGRYRTPGTFGVTGTCPSIDRYIVESIEQNRFRPIQRIFWRNNKIDFRSIQALMYTLAKSDDNPLLAQARKASDVTALEGIAQTPEIVKYLVSHADVKLLWHVCQIPDFRKFGSTQHLELVKTIYTFIHDGEYIPSDWIERQVLRIDNTNGDIETLATNLAFIRTWTYVAQRANWVENTHYWRERSSAIEDRLSDALHDRLTQRFIDRRTSILVKSLKQEGKLVADLNISGQLCLDGQVLGEFQGFRFNRSLGSTPEEERVSKAACAKLLGPEYLIRARQLSNAPDNELGLSEQGGILWGESAIGQLIVGHDIYQPGIKIFVDEEVEKDVVEIIKRRIDAYIDHMIAQNLEKLLEIRNDEQLTGNVRGFAFRLVENFGILNRADVAKDVSELDQESRALLRKYGVKFGQHTIFMYSAIRPKATQLRVLLWSLSSGFEEFPPPPPPGLTTIPKNSNMPDGYYPVSGFVDLGTRAVRVDILDRLMMLLWDCDGRKGFEASDEMLSITGLSHENFAELMQGLGFKANKGERIKQPNIHANSESDSTNTEDLDNSSQSEQVEGAPLESSSIVNTVDVDTKTHVAYEETKTRIELGLETVSENSETITEDIQGVDAMVEFYTFTRQPRRHKAKPERRREHKTPDRAKFDKSKKLHSSNVARKTIKHDERAKKESYRNPSVNRKRKVADPNSPFAALLEIRDEL